MDVLLNESVSVKLNSSGAGTAKIGPISAREVWSPSNVHVSCSTNVNEAQCNIYVGDSAIQRNYIDGTFSGSSGDSTDSVGSTVIKVGQYVWAVWTGGDSNTTATVSVTGQKAI